jgi:hypothetical protein
MQPCETTYIYDDTENFEHEGYKHTNSNKDNQGMWRGCISMFTVGELWFIMILWKNLNAMKGSHSPPLAQPMK